MQATFRTSTFSGKGNIVKEFKAFSDILLQAGVIKGKDKIGKMDVEGWVICLKHTDAATGKYVFQLEYVPAALFTAHRVNLQQANNSSISVEAIFDADVTKCKNGKIRSRKSKDLLNIYNVEQETKYTVLDSSVLLARIGK